MWHEISLTHEFRAEHAGCVPYRRYHPRGNRHPLVADHERATGGSGSPITQAA